MEAVEKESLPRRIENLIKEKYKFNSLADFEKLSVKEQRDILADCYFLLGSREDEVSESYVEDWNKLCAIFGFEEKRIFPESSIESYGKEYIEIFRPYTDKYREFYRQEDLQNRGLDNSGKKEPNPLLAILMDNEKINKYSDWFNLSLDEKREIMNNAGLSIVWDDVVGQDRHIRLGYELLQPEKYQSVGGYQALKNNIKDRYFRSGEEKLSAEEALYDKQYIARLMIGYSIMDMGVLPKTAEEAKRFDDLSSSEFNIEQARQILQDSKMSEELKKQILETFEKRGK